MTAWFFKFPLRPSLGGGEFFCLQTALTLKELGYNIRLVTSDPRLFRLFEKHALPRVRRTLGQEPVSKRALLLWPLTWILGKLKTKYLLLGIRRGDAVFFHSLADKLLMTHAANRQGAKVFWLEHKIPGRWLLWNPLRFQYQQMAKKAVILTTSEFSKNRFCDLGLDEGRIVTLYPAAVIGKQGKRNNFCVGILSRLDPEKGIANFITTILPFFKQNPKWRLLIAGEGEEENAIRKLITDSGMSAQIQMLGLVSDQKAFFEGISVFVYPTRAEETFGMSILEAEAAGCPVAASNRGAIAEVLSEEAGYLVTDVGPRSWEYAFNQFADPDKYAKFSQQAQERAQRFSRERLALSLKNLITI